MPSRANGVRHLPIFLCAVAWCFAASAAQAQERLRWELVTSGSSDLGSSDKIAPDATVPKLTGPNATFLFHLDAQPFLNYGSDSHALLSRHLLFETGIVPVGRTVNARADTSTSPVIESLVSQGVSVTGTTKPGTTLSIQRAFTVGGEFSANRLFKAQGAGTLMELGGVVKGHFDAFLDDTRFFEKDGVTYVTVGRPNGGESGYYRAEAGARFRISQPEEAMAAVTANGETKGGNVEDLLLFEFLYQRNNALFGLVPGVDTVNRILMRFLATPEVPNLKDTKMLIGIEMSNDRKGEAVKDVRIFYGVNLNLKSLF
jgi:hypothetical protein